MTGLKMTRKSALLACVSISAIALADAAIGVAQAQGLEEIVVTARKREETLMTIPVSITAVSADSIASKGIKSIEEMARFTPGFFSIYMNAGGGARNDRSAKQITFRGFSIAPGIMFVDGAPVSASNTNGITPDFADIERVEVLKGPQNAYFGRSTFSGAINYITKTPGNEFKGVVSAEYASYGSNDLLMSVEGPIAEDKLAMRVTAHHMARGGHYINSLNTSERLGNRRTDSISGSFYFTPTDNIKVKGWASYAADRDGPPAQVGIKRPQLNCNLGGSGGPYWCGTLPTADQLPAATIGGQYVMDAFTRSILSENVRGFYAPFDPRWQDSYGLKRHAFQGNLKFEYETAGGYSFASVSSYNRTKSLNFLDLTYYGILNANPLYNSTPGATNAAGIFPTIRWAHANGGIDWVFNQEFRVTSPAQNRLRWLAGVNYLQAYGVGFPVYGYSNAGVAGLGGASQQRPRTQSLFGGAYYDITPELTLTGEVRYQWDKPHSKTLTDGSGTNILANPIALTRTFKSFSPRVSLDWKYAPNSLAYALWSRGTRPGGYNAGLITQPPAIIAQLSAVGGQVTFREDRIDNFEAGLKSSWLNDTLQTRVALYYDQWRNGQVPNTIQFVTTPAATPANPNPLPTVSSFTITQNVGSINLYGIELEADWAVTDKLLVNATLNISDNKISGNYLCSDCLLIYGRATLPANAKIRFAPRQTWSLSAEYTDHLAGAYDWFTRVDYTHRGSFFGDEGNVSVIGAADLVNLRVGVRKEDGLSIEGYVKNLTKDATLLQGTRGQDTVFSFAAFNEIRVGLPDKREFGVKATYKF